MRLKIILAIGSMAFAGIGASAAIACNSPVPVFAEGSEVSTEESIVEEEPKTPYAQATEWIKDKVIPIFGGISVATLVSAGVSIATAIAKISGDRKNRKVILDQNAVVEDLQGKVTALTAENKAYQEFSKQMLANYETVLGQTYEVLQQVSDNAKAITEEVAAQNIRIEKVEKMKTTIEASCDLIAKSLALSEVAVKSGIAQDAQKLVDSLQGGNPNEQEG